MCTASSGKLIAWMDGELPEAEAAAIARHVEGCAGCRAEFEACRDAGAAFESYCEATLAAVHATRPARSADRARARWTFAGAGAAAAVALLAVAIPWARRATRPAPPGAASPSVMQPAVVPSQSPWAATSLRAVQAASVTRGVRRRTLQRAAAAMAPAAETRAREAAVKITIPATAIFPAGAAPEGLSFAAEIRVAPDGTTAELLLQPQLTAFQTGEPRP